MEACIKAAKTYGIAMCSVQHSNHFGMSASYALQAAEADMMSMVFTNSSPAARHLTSTHGCCADLGSDASMGRQGEADGRQSDLCGRARCRGRNTIHHGSHAFSRSERVRCPKDGHSNILTVCRKVYRALRRNEKIPLDWALDKQVSALQLCSPCIDAFQGRATDDPAEALEGVMLPIGG